MSSSGDIFQALHSRFLSFPLYSIYLSLHLGQFFLLISWVTNHPTIMLCAIFPARPKNMLCLLVFKFHVESQAERGLRIKC